MGTLLGLLDHLSHKHDVERIHLRIPKLIVSPKGRCYERYTDTERKGGYEILWMSSAYKNKPSLRIMWHKDEYYVMYVSKNFGPVLIDLSNGDIDITPCLNYPCAEPSSDSPELDIL